ncbi:hypothetical protein B9Z51_08755 [Limnohabitans sp. T6-5]|uniref:hypothetical protein n=1 Tax=Limnohabitans sp. T6-5 TaxID=1100724 RepID=UPI000D3D1B7E|nr:hypothetical protein [Limnohabitans sp. T6-5]PUE09010.1 hypothetical protein B9Z51_08755 [Limnohabitans sp. T6-5]
MTLLSAKPEAAPIAACPACESSQQRPVSGTYRMACQECCARLLSTTRPQSPQAEAMLSLIARNIKRLAPAFGLDDVKASARLLVQKRRSAMTK